MDKLVSNFGMLYNIIITTEKEGGLTNRLPGSNERNKK